MAQQSVTEFTSHTPIRELERRLEIVLDELRLCDDPAREDVLQAELTALLDKHRALLDSPGAGG